MLYRELQQIIERVPDKTALVAGNESLTYRQLDTKIINVAALLNHHNIGANDAVIVLLANGASFIEGVWGTLALGAIAVPINPLFPADEIKHYLETSGAKMVLHEDSLGDLLDKIAPEITKISRTRLGQFTGEISALSLDAPNEHSPALYMYSSGSTGKPKRVTRTHGQLTAERKALAATIDLTPDDRILCTVPLYHSHGFGNCMLAALLNGGTLIIAPGEFNSRDTIRIIERERITVYPAVPFMFKMIGETFFKNRPDLNSVRLLLSAGAALPVAVFENFYSKFGMPIRQLYGSTETGAVAINTDGGSGTESSVGRPLVGYQIDIIDESGAPLSNGESGLIAIRSPAQTHRYDDLPEVSAECFIGDYFLPGDTGTKDAGGNIFIQGRKKLLINVAGYKVDPIDVENVISTYPKIKDVVVLGQEEANSGEIVKAVVVANDTCTANEIIQHCAQQLAPYKVPKIVEFRNEIPRNPLGKILRKYLQS